MTTPNVALQTAHNLSNHAASLRGHGGGNGVPLHLAEDTQHVDVPLPGQPLDVGEGVQQRAVQPTAPDGRARGEVGLRFAASQALAWPTLAGGDCPCGYPVVTLLYPTVTLL